MKTHLTVLLVAVAAFTITINGYAQDQAAKPLTDREIAFHLLNRMAFGPGPGDVDRVIKMGHKAWIQEQLKPSSIDDSELDSRLDESFPSRKMTMEEIFSEYRPEYKANEDTATVEKRNRLRGQIREELADAVVVRAVLSKRQFHEVIVEFWRNHFNVDTNKDDVVYLANHWEENVIRRLAWGKFENLLLATAHHPAMLIYLDNAVSQKPIIEQPAQQRRGAFNRREKPQPVRRPDARQRGLNENYARELMELHTLGVDNYYSQRDVYELARVLTGWSVGWYESAGKKTYGFKFNQDWHDTYDKVIFGQRLPGNGGLPLGINVVRSLANHKGTSEFLSYKLCRYLLNDYPPKDMVKRIASVWRRHDGRLSEVYEAIVTSPEFLKREHFRTKFKTPFEFAVSSIRATGAQIKQTRDVRYALHNMGQPVYTCEDPTGYYDQAEAWLDPGVLFHRWSFALSLAHERIKGIEIPREFWRQFGGKSPEEVKDWLIQQTLPGGIDERTAKAMDQAVEKNQSGSYFSQLYGLVLGSPTFQQQ